MMSRKLTYLGIFKKNLTLNRNCCIMLAVLALTCLCGNYASAGKTSFTVVLDPGHGGRDIGCQGTRGKEKEIVLDVARRVEKLINANPQDSIKAITTRNSDIFVPLENRARIANDADADLFVSIHVNSVSKKNRNRRNIHGASVYTVGLHKSEANLAVAMRENGVIELEEDYTAKYQGFDPASAESYIIFELDQNRHIAQSIDVASMICHNLVAEAGRADKGVLQAGFLVLWATRMPAVLIELDFICNPAAEQFLTSEKGRAQCAKAIYNAIVEYKNKISKQ